MFYIILYASSFILAINADDWFIIWLGLEVNIIVFVVMIYERYRIKHIESCLKYFFIQRLGSGLFIGIFYLNKDLLRYIGSLILRYKVGAGPFFFWFPSVARGLGWWSCIILFSLQKVIPLILLVIFIRWLVWFILIVRLLFGILGSLNQIHIKRLLAFSSIHHIGWLLICNNIDRGIWIVYLLIYMFVIFSVILIFSYFEIENLIGVNKYKNKWWFLLRILRIGGMPPFLGFFIKWLAFKCFIDIDYWVIFFIIIISVTMFYVYVRVIYNVFIGSGDEMRWVNFYEYKYIMKIDILRVVGLVFGSFIGIWILY